MTRKCHVQFLGEGAAATPSPYPTCQERVFGGGRAERKQHFTAAARPQLGKTAFNVAWAEGRAMSLEQAIELALREE